MKFRLCKWLLLQFCTICFIINALGREQVVWARAPARARVLIVKTRDSAFYNPMVEGLINGLKSRGYRSGSQIDLVVTTLVGKPEDDEKMVLGQLSKKPQLVLAVGTDAATLLLRKKTEIPVLFSMVLDPVSLRLVKSLDVPGGNFSGTTLLVSPGKQLDNLLQAVPTVQKIGVLFTEGDPTSLAFLNEARKDAERLHVELVAHAARHPETPAQDLAELKEVDALWLIPDPVSTGGIALKATLDYGRAHNLPVLGASSSTVRAGAVLALSANLQDLGDLTADMAAHVLDGSETPARMRVRGPRLTLLSINLDTVRGLKLKIPEAMLHLADEVIDTH